MTVSMTGFAARKGQGAGFSWVWDLRSVNGKGLDLRLRVPDWIDGLEPALKAELSKQLHRGNVSLSLKLTRDETAGTDALGLNTAMLAGVLAALKQIEDAAMHAGVTLGQPTGADVLGVRGVTEAQATDTDPAPIRAALMADLAPLLAEFKAMRATEGRALQGIIAAQLDRIADLLTQAQSEAEARQASAGTTLQAAVAKILGAADGIDPARLAQELALIAVKNDVTEELDRLTAHVDAARDLLAEPGQIGRKFDFLTQEFMREANTLCSKSQSLGLTRVGLDLKTVIDQMREQVQNVE
ncbi:MAG: YicC/YloC family endoribonuclease [Cypionkella sp.]